jgi:hypothetical protein
MSQVTGNITVTADEKRNTIVPSFANFLTVSSVGSDVQFEFMFVDLSDLAAHIDKAKQGGGTDFTCMGKTVSKLIVPAASFVQLKNHLAQMFERLEAQLNDQTTGKKTAQESGHGD